MNMLPMYIDVRKWSAREEVAEVDRNQREQARDDHAAGNSGATPPGQGNCGTLMCSPLYTQSVSIVCLSLP